MAAKNYTSNFADIPFGHNNTSGPTRTLHHPYLENVDFNFKLSSHFLPYLGQIVNSDKVFGNLPIENLKGISKLSFLIIHAIKGTEKLQNTK